MSRALNTYSPMVLLIYFFNAFLLPHGLLYSSILTPVFILWLYKNGERNLLIWPPLAVILVSTFHLFSKAILLDLVVSSGLFISAYFFALMLWRWFEKTPINKELMDLVLKWNTLFVMLALILVPFAFGRALLWYEIPISPDIEPFPRLKLFTYEASYYAFLWTPVFLFYGWRIVFGLEKRWFLVVLAIAIPLLLSLSFGVIGAIFLSISLVIGIYAQKLFPIKGIQKLVLYSLALLITSGILLLLFYPSNPVFLRIANIFQGEDTSASGRLFDSFKFAFDLAQAHSLLLGVGLGQIKVFAHDLIINYYQYEGDYAEIVRIPNAMAEWLATFGIVGFIFKLALEVRWFFQYKLYFNYFNLSLFLVVFIYQFTGSFLVSTAEIILWVVAIKARFPEMDVSPTNDTAK